MAYILFLATVAKAWAEDLYFGVLRAFGNLIGKVGRARAAAFIPPQRSARLRKWVAWQRRSREDREDWLRVEGEWRWLANAG